MTWRQGVVYRALKRAAEAGAACPSNAVLAELIGCCARTPMRIIRELEEKGLVNVTLLGPERRVTIVATGKSTAAGGPHGGQERGAA